MIRVLVNEGMIFILFYLIIHLYHVKKIKKRPDGGVDPPSAAALLSLDIDTDRSVCMYILYYVYLCVPV